MKEDNTKETTYSKFVWDKADQTELYKDVLFDLIEDPENIYRGEIIMAKNENDFAKIIIGTNFLGKYIVQLVNDMISFIGKKHGWEESEDEIRKEIGLEILQKYINGNLD